MGLFDGLKSTFNIGGCQIGIITDDDEYTQGDAITGHVVITGGSYKQAGSSIQLHLKEFWTETRTTGGNPPSTTTVTVYGTRQTVRLADQFSLEAESQREFSFEVQLQPNCRISTRSTGWALFVSLDIPNAIDPTARIKLGILPSEEFQAIATAITGKMKFVESQGYRRWCSDNRTVMRFLPPEALKKEFDYLELTLFRNADGSVLARLNFDLQEKSLGDYFKAIFGGDNIYHDITFAQDEIFLDDLSPNAAAIAKKIGALAQQIIEERST